MNRTIKFRAKRENDGEWVYGLYIHNETRHFIVPDNTDFSSDYYNNLTCMADEIIPETVGQFTGLLDKAGGEGISIYEGDILRQANGMIWAVVYTLDGIRLVRNGGENERPLVSVSLSNIVGHEFLYEIIGNIHDTPKLLEENK